MDRTDGRPLPPVRPPDESLAADMAGLTDEVTRLTGEYGGPWGMNHTRRLLALVTLVAEDEPYDGPAVWLAAHLHDWGAYRPWAESGVDHVQRSLGVAGPFLTERGCLDDLQARVLESIAHHHSEVLEPGLSREAALLHDADVLDFLGVVGIARDISKNPKDLRGGYEAALRRRERLPQTLFLPKSKELAAPRLREMDDFLAAFKAGSFGWF